MEANITDIEYIVVMYSPYGCELICEASTLVLLLYDLEDLSDDEIETIYRQFANFLLQLFKLEFECISNLDSPTQSSASRYGH